MPPGSHPQQDEQVVRERHRLLTRLSKAMLKPMIVLSFVWLALLVASLTSGLSPFFQGLSYAIWALFALQFLVEWVIAPRKLRYLRRQWITAIALLVPAVRLLSIFRVARVLTLARGTQLVRVLGGANRGMRALGRVMDRRGVGYVLMLTLIVAFAGAAGVYHFERQLPETRMDSFATAVWWTTMTLTTMGTDFFPVSGEGRALSLILAIYGFAIFGYLTATVASYFVARDVEEGVTPPADQPLEAVRRELSLVREELERLRRDRDGAP